MTPKDIFNLLRGMGSVIEICPHTEKKARITIIAYDPEEAMIELNLAWEDLNEDFGAAVYGALTREPKLSHAHVVFDELKPTEDGVYTHEMVPWHLLDEALHAG